MRVSILVVYFKIVNTGANTLTVDPDGTEQLYGAGAGVSQTLILGENIDIHDEIDQASEMLRKKGLVNKGDKLVYVAGIPMHKREPVNMVKISVV